VLDPLASSVLEEQTLLSRRRLLAPAAVRKRVVVEVPAPPAGTQYTALDGATSSIDRFG